MTFKELGRNSWWQRLVSVIDRVCRKAFNVG
jgi:hypothetical protein